ncbi:heterokaryon incompatibility, partial [Massarina eburnea CBS 473.64]
VTDLLETFQDAIMTYRVLGIRYLWIDSLCILQDDPVDWQAHVTIMDAIYEHAHITFAARASEDGNIGLF